jgi:hypothetical protein
MTTISLGAINKNTGEYVYPKIANKKDKYSCPDCHKDLIICQGKIRVHHFRHKVDSITPCHRYSHPSESQTHKDAKLLLKMVLERKIPISFIRNCCFCNSAKEYEIPCITNTSSIQLEYSFEYNGKKSADVAYIDNGEIICIFEIYHSHKTKEENRPEPWFEMDALSLIQNMNDINIDSFKIQCIRCEKCDECMEKIRNENIKLQLIEQRKQQELQLLEQRKQETLREQNELYLMRYNDELLQQRIKERQYRMNERREKNRQRIENELKEEIKNRMEYIKMMKEIEIEQQKYTEQTKILQNKCSKTCGLSEICICENPRFVLSFNNMYCKCCNKWKCRCI